MGFWKALYENITVWLIFIGLAGTLINFGLCHLVNRFAASIEFTDADNASWQVIYALVAYLLRDQNKLRISRAFRAEIRRLTKLLKKSMWETVERDDPAYTAKSDINLNTAITDASQAFHNVMEQSSWALINISSVVSYLFVIWGKSPTVGLWITITTTLTIISGSLLMRSNHEEKSKLNKEMNPLSSFVKSLSDNFLFENLNGDGPKTLDKIIKLTSEKDEASFQISQSHYSRCERLFAFNSVLTVLSIIVNRGDFQNPAQLAVIFKLTLELCEPSWNLFNVFNTVSTASAEWASWDKYLSGYKPLISNRKHLKNVQQVKKILFPDINIPSNIKRVRIDGPKGSGKTTWMKSAVFYLYNHFNLGQFIYIHQKIDVTISKFVNIREYIVNGETNIDDGTILEWAVKLGIANKINELTLDQPFNGLSGGETKIVNILRYFLPILRGNPKQTRVVFGDEITANLDRESQAKVGFLLNQVAKRGVLIIEADHNPSSIFSIPVKKLKNF